MAELCDAAPTRGKADPLIHSRGAGLAELALQEFKPQQPQRKAPLHFPPIEMGFRSVIIYLTICVHRRRPLLANDTAARLIIEPWEAANFWCVGRYVIMPDHIHLFCAPNTFPARPLKNWVSFWRNHVTRRWPHVIKFLFCSVIIGIGSCDATN